MISRFSFPTRIVFGEGAVQEVGTLAAGLGAKRALIVADRGVVAVGLTEPVAKSLASAGIEHRVFDGISPNPTEENVDTGAAAYRNFGADLVVGVGGGSALDGAKAVRLRATHDLPLDRYDDNIGGDALIRDDMPPMIAIPTTAGTGSEVGRSTVIVCRANERKTVIFSPHLMADFAVCDPVLTAGMPPQITAATGMDALTHNIESYLATGYHPMADGIALAGIRHCARSLQRAVECGSDLGARADMMMAAMMGATAFQKGLGVAHSLAHPLSTIAGMHHGMANAVVLPYTVDFNASACPERFADIAQVLDLPRTPEAISGWVRALNASIGIPDNLRGFGVTEAMIAPMVAKALEDGCWRSNPRPCTAEDIEALYRAAL